MTAIHLGRLARSSGLQEPKDVRIGLLQNTTRNFREMLIAPSSSGDPCPRMDTDEKRVKGNTLREKKRPGVGMMRVCQSESIQLGVRQYIYCLQQVQPNINPMRAGRIRRDLVGQQATAPANTVPDSPARTA